MPPTTPSSPAVPDYVMLLPAPPALDVVALRKGRPLWVRRFDLASPAALAVTLAEQAPALRLPNGIAAGLVVPPEVGGFLFLPGAGARRQDIDQQARSALASLPFRADEIRWRILPRASGNELFWLPADWIAAQKASLQGCGLDLADLFPRGALFRAVDPVEQVLIIEGDALHHVDGGLLRRSAALPVNPGERRQALDMALLATASGAPALLEQPPLDARTLETRALALWRDGDESLAVDPRRMALWQPLLRDLGRAAAVVAVLALGLFTGTAELERRLDAAQADYRRIAPQAMRLADQERTALAYQKATAALKRFDETPSPLDALSSVAAALPDGRWIQKVNFAAGRLEISGQGGSADELLPLLRAKGLVAGNKTAADAAPATFRIEITLPTPKPAAEVRK